MQAAADPFPHPGDDRARPLYVGYIYRATPWARASSSRLWSHAPVIRTAPGAAAPSTRRRGASSAVGDCPRRPRPERRGAPGTATGGCGPPTGDRPRHQATAGPRRCLHGLQHPVDPPRVWVFAEFRQSVAKLVPVTGSLRQQEQERRLSELVRSVHGREECFHRAVGAVAVRTHGSVPWCVTGDIRPAEHRPCPATRSGAAARTK